MPVSHLRPPTCQPTDQNAYAFKGLGYEDFSNQLGPSPTKIAIFYLLQLKSPRDIRSPGFSLSQGSETILRGLSISVFPEFCSL
ncbi:hypothetical protein TNIN_153691 [Trichonephila inaurata madagascariensis]|uniref:Uncharacterized protein n=1 Tax=Trichonephila inaurata madagascariensis TaxID=2747483 RepID=A0A8X6XVK9_9ARAC|nr:hypothetical protein TNIN_153691 [Trichonephila inaurata madagascariensis]